MRDCFMRLTAVLLLVCTLVSFVVPATFADTPAAATVYDFDLANSTDPAISAYTWDGVKLNKQPGRADGETNTKTGWKLLEELYTDPSNSLNWKGEAYSTTAEQSKIDKNKGGLFTYVATTQTSGYLALRLAAPATGAGQYNVSLTSTDARNTIDVYLLDAADYTTPQAAMVEENKIFTGLKTNGTHEADTPVLVDGGEMILVFHTTNIVAKTRHIISNVTLTPVTGGTEPTVTTEATEASETTVTTAPETTATVQTQPSDAATVPGVFDKLYADGIYDFELYNYDRYTPMLNNNKDTYALSAGAAADLEGVYESGDLSKDILEADYPNVLNWKVEGIDSSMTYANLTLYKTANAGMRIQKPATAQAESGWVAFRIAVPRSGKYDLYAVCESSWVAHSVYVFPADAKTMSETDLEGKMTADNLVGAPIATSKHTAQEPYTETYYNIDLTAGEYIIVFKMAETIAKATIYLSGLELLPASGQEAPTEPSTQPTQPEELIPGGATKENFFDIELYRYEAFRDMAGIDIKYSAVEKLLKDSYPNNVNWKIEGFTEGSSVYFRGATKQGIRAEVGSGNYIAFRVDVAKAATYHIAISSVYDVYPYNATAYMIPAPAETMTHEQILAAITDDNKLGDYEFTTDNLNCAFMDQKVEKAGEYVLIFVAGERDRIYLSSIDFLEAGVETPKEEKDKVLYDFNLVAIKPDIRQNTLTSWSDDTKKERVSDILARWYEEGTLQWKNECRSETAITEAIREKYLRFKATQDMLEVDNGWNAFRLRAPGTGTYDVRLTGIEKNTAVINFYLIPAVTGVSMTAEQIEAGMVKENLLIEKARISGEDTFYLGEYTFGVEHEYVLVMEFVRGTRLNLVSIEMTKDGLVADGALPVGEKVPGVVYDFDVADAFEGAFYKEKRYNMADILSDLNARWNSGAQNWKWISASDTLVASDAKGNIIPGKYLRFNRNGGMYIYGEQDAWIAFKIKSPGEGDFTVSMNHAICPDSGTVAMYILPADTDPDKLWEATDPANRVGMVTLTNDTGLAGVEDGFTSFVGYYNFEAGKEYILLLEGYTASRYNEARANMNISQIFMEKGIKDYKKPEETKVVNSIAVAESVVSVADSGTGNFAMFEMNGMDYYLVQLEGGAMYLYNLDTGELEDEQYIRGSRPRHMAVAEDGKVWIANAWKYLVCYDPVTKTYEKTRPYMPSEFKHNGFSYLTFDEEGNIYSALNGIGYIIKYDPKTKVYTNLGILRGEKDVTQSIIYKDGYLYAHCLLSGEYNSVVKYNVATGEVEGTCEFMDIAGDNTAYGIGFLGEDVLAVGVITTDNDCAVTVDINTMELIDIGMPGPINYCVSEKINGKQYMVSSTYGLYEYDETTRTVSKVPGFASMSASGFRSGGQSPGGKSWATINGDICLISNLTKEHCCPRVINLVTKEYYEWRDLTRGASGGGSEIISFTNGAEGANEVIMGFWNAHFAATYNTETGTITNIADTAGQTDSIAFYKGILYGGCYSATVLVEIDRERNEYIQRFKLDHEITGQKRLLSMETGGDYVFVGSIPETHQVGGSLTVYNTLTGQWYTERNLIPDQSIVDEAYCNGLVFIASSRSGGDSTNPSGDSALIMAYDYENRKPLATLDPRDYVPGLPSPVHYIYGLTADPNAEENGRVWAAVGDTLLCFTFDRETCKFDVQVVMSFNISAYFTSSGVSRQQSKLRFIEEKNQLYIVFKNAGTYCLTLEDWNAPVGKVKIVEKERIMSHKPEDYIIAEDGNMYFGDVGDLMILPLNVTDEDWAISQQVDDLINAIGEVTLESEAAIKSARSAYENLAWKYKALVQKLNLLEEAEADLLECKIAAWEGKEITADDVDALQTLMDIYKPMNVRQKRYVKNYLMLRTSYEQADKLNDQRIAAAMQEKVNALKDIMPIETLEKEPRVVAVRTELDSLTGSQQYLVDTTILKEAEAQVVVLRAEFVKEVEALIQAIPAQITLEAEPAITAAREGVDKLYQLERKQVSYSKLETAESKLRNLKNALAKAQEFDALMKEIGIVTLGDAQRIAYARKFYSSLNETARAFATKYAKLQRAEFILKALQTWGIPAIVAVVAGAGFCVTWFVPSLHKKVFKTKKKEETEVIDN